MGKNVVIIGSGFAGLAAASFLAEAGFRVTVLEKNESPGGRARQFTTEDGYVFDMGPSWYWMPDVFEQFFAHFGKKPADYYHLVRLDPSYCVHFGAENRMDVPANMADLEALFERYEPGSAPKLRRFIAEAEYKYKVGMADFVHKPSHSIWEFADARIAASLFRLQMFTSISRHIRSLFHNEYLIQLLEFPVLFLGATPQKTPALYSLMNYADMALGTWYPMGGMHKIVEGMVQLATELGVVFHYGAEVTSIEVHHDQATRVHTRSGETYPAAVLVGGADYHHIEQALLSAPDRDYSEKYWDSRTLAPSSLLFYLGVNKRLKNVLHHNLFFDADFSLHAHEIYETPKWPSNPLFYVSVPSVTDPSVAPSGCENVFLLMPVAPALDDAEDTREAYYDLMMTRLERLTGQSVREAVVYKRAYAHANFIQDYHAYKGNAYGLANTLWQTAFLKPRLKSRKVSNLYYTGQLTVPGPGVPPSLISGEVVAKEVIKTFL